MMTPRHITCLLCCLVFAAGAARGTVNYKGAPDDILRILSPPSDNPAARTYRMDPEQERRLRDLSRNELAEEDWPELLKSLGDPAQRIRIRERLLNVDTFPRETLVGLLRHEELAVRLGALEWLEEKFSITQGYDPWQSADTRENQTALRAWDDWLRQDADSLIREPRRLSPEQVEQTLSDFAQGTPQQAARAFRTLIAAGRSVVPAMRAYGRARPNMPPDQRLRLRELQYRLQIPPVSFINPQRLSHRLVYGDVDTRAASIAKLSLCGPDATPLLSEMLNDPNPLIREAAGEALMDAAQARAVPILEQRLEEETDEDVIYAMLRGLRNIDNKAARTLLSSFFTHENEDLVLAALDSVSHMESPSLARAIEPCLEDSRWRVRAAALAAGATLSADGWEKHLPALLKDPDEFVRYTAVSALPELGGKTKSIPLLEKLYFEEEALRIPILQTILTLGKSFPKSIKTDLQSADSEQALQIIALVADHADKHSALLLEYAEDDNLDISCGALRSLAQAGAEQGQVRAVLVDALNSHIPEKQQAVLNSLRVPGDVAKGRPNLRRAETENPRVSQEMEDLFGSFLENTPSPPSAPAAEPPASAPTVEDLFSAFDRTPSSSTSSGVRKRADWSELSEAIASCTTSEDPDIRVLAITALAPLAPDRALEILAEARHELSPEQMQSFCKALRFAGDDQSLQWLTRSLHSLTRDVRVAAAEACLEQTYGRDGLSALLNALCEEDTPFHLEEIETYRLTQAITKNKRTASDWARQTLSNNEANPEALQTALTILALIGRKPDVADVEPFLTHESPSIRATAWQALARFDFTGFIQRAGDIADDPAVEMRSALVQILSPQGQSLIIFLSEDRTFEVNSYSVRSRRRRGAALEKRQHLLQRLAEDPLPKVRLKALMSLWATGRPLSVDQVIQTLMDHSPDDREAAAARVADLLTDRINKAPASFARLLPILRKNGVSNYDMEKLEKVLSKKMAGQAFVLNEPTHQPAPVKKLSEEQAIPSPPGFTVVLFHTPDCGECEQIEGWLEDWKDEFPGLVVERHSILNLDGRRLQDAYIDQMDADPRQSGLTPFLVTAVGCLPRGDLEEPSALFDDLLIARDMPDREWVIPPESITEAEPAILSPPSEPPPPSVKESRSAPSPYLLLFVLVLPVVWMWMRKKGEV